MALGLNCPHPLACTVICAASYSLTSTLYAQTHRFCLLDGPTQHVNEHKGWVMDKCPQRVTMKHRGITQYRPCKNDPLLCVYVSIPIPVSFLFFLLLLPFAGKYWFTCWIKSINDINQHWRERGEASMIAFTLLMGLQKRGGKKERNRKEGRERATRREK